MSSLQIWRPFTQEKNTVNSIAVNYGQGSYIIDKAGKKYLDLISSWWVNLHGHGNTEIAEAIYRQAKKLEHVIFTKFTHEPAEEICCKLYSALQKSSSNSKLCKFFFSDNGSTAVEIALKMAYQYWLNNGVTCKKKFVSFCGGYHGDTFGAMGVGSGYHEAFKDLCFNSLKISWPSTWIGDKNIEEKEHIAIAEYEKYIYEYGNKIAAIIVEPMVQGASGMRMIRAEFLQRVFNLSQENNIIVIFDEVMTGFYRTGKMFAYEYLNTSSNRGLYIPDILCLSKGITGGFLPLSLTITSDKIFSSFLDDSGKKTFIHGHSYTANPIACAAAVASFDILQRHECLQRINAINRVHTEYSQQLIQCNCIKNIRILGTILAFEITMHEKLSAIVAQMFDNGYFIRPIGNIIYFIPPYSTIPDDLRKAYETLLCIIESCKKYLT